MGKRSHPAVYSKRAAKIERASAEAVVPVNPDKRAQGDKNWRVRQLSHCVMAFEPDGEHEQVFTGGPDPFWDAVEYAARCLRGEIALP